MVVGKAMQSLACQFVLIPADAHRWWCQEKHLVTIALVCNESPTLGMASICTLLNTGIHNRLKRLVLYGCGIGSESLPNRYSALSLAHVCACVTGLQLYRFGRFAIGSFYPSRTSLFYLWISVSNKNQDFALCCFQRKTHSTQTSANCSSF